MTKLFTIGPTEMYEVTKETRRQDIPYFRNQDFSDVMLEADRMLKDCMKTAESSQGIYLTASGTAAMEAVVMNLIRKGDRVLVVAGGTFGKRFSEICSIHGAETDVISLADMEVLEWKHFEPFTANEYKAVLVNLHETSTGQLYDIELFKKFVAGKDTLLIVDAISTFLCDDFAMDANGIDAVIISTQKGLCVSPGMSVVMMNEKTAAMVKSTEEIGNIYFDFNDYMLNMKRGQTPFTPAVGICFEIRDMLKYITDQGLEARLAEVKGRTDAFRSIIAAAEGISIPSFSKSNAITTVIFDKPVAKAVEQELKDTLGYFINPSGGEAGEYRFRVSHVGALTEEETVKLAETIVEIYNRLA